MRKSAITVIMLLLSLTSCGLLGSGNDDGPPRTIAFSAQDDNGTFQIYKMREDGSGVRRLTNGKYSSTDPAWSPDGNRIAYSRSDGSTEGEALWVMDADGDNKQPLVTNHRTGSPQLGNHPAWSPDGKKVAFDRCMNCEFGGSNFEILVTDLQAGTIDTLTDHPVEDSHPTWSPDGEQIAFTSNRDYFDADTMRWRKDLYVISKDEAGLERLTETGNATRPNWSPVGNKVAYEWNIRGNEVYIFNFVTNQTINLKPGLQFIGNPLWNRQGDRLLVFGRKTEQSESQMKFLNIKKNTTEILQTVTLDDDAIGRNYDWYNEN